MPDSKHRRPRGDRDYQTSPIERTRTTKAEATPGSRSCKAAAAIDELDMPANLPADDRISQRRIVLGICTDGGHLPQRFRRNRLTHRCACLSETSVAAG